MTPIVPRVAIFSYQSIDTCIKTSDPYDWLAKYFETHLFTSDVDPSFLINERFSVIVIVGDKHYWRQASKSTLPILYLDSPDQLNGDLVYDFYVNTLEQYNPTVSIFSPAHNTFEKFDRCYGSVINQSYENWEWVILDDSPDRKNYEYIEKKIGNDPRIKLYKANRKDSMVGSTKRQAASLCNGQYLLELDHDDELHYMALEYVVSAFKRYPDAGFCYSNCAEVFETGGSVVYGPTFAMHQGLHFPYTYKGVEMMGADTPINASTMRHIVGVPNHLRCWERETYFRIGRHNNKLAIVDDYELLIRTFLETKIVQIPEVLYIQYMNAGGNNTQEPRRAEIQRLVDRLQKKYDLDIHNRVLELGGEDWLWDENTQTSLTWINPPTINKRVTLAYVYKL